MTDYPAKRVLSFDIWVSEHARTRARERFPGFKAARIIDEVRDAVRAGDISADPPSGVTYWRRSYEVLYVWNKERVYPLKIMPGNGGFMVVTTVERMS